MNSPKSVEVADLDTDGNLDIVAGNGFPDSISVLLGNGDGTFQTAQAFLAAGMVPESVAVADLNADGNLDIVTASFLDDVSVLLGNGDGTFQTAQFFAAGDGSLSVAVADLNADGALDLVTANRDSSNVSVLLHR